MAHAPEHSMHPSRTMAPHKTGPSKPAPQVDLKNTTSPPKH